MRSRTRTGSIALRKEGLGESSHQIVITTQMKRRAPRALAKTLTLTLYLLIAPQTHLSLITIVRALRRTMSVMALQAVTAAAAGCSVEVAVRFTTKKKTVLAPSEHVNALALERTMVTFAPAKPAS